MATIFVSPGVYTKEQDFSVFASRIGTTRLGIVGKTLKGPAFEAIKVTSSDEFYLRFGGTHPDYPSSYVANSFLSQANDLTISRVLGSGGFTNSPAWLIVADSVSLYTGTTETSGATFSASDTTGTTTYTITFEELAGVAGYVSAGTPSGGAITVNYSAATMYMASTALTIDSNWISYGVSVTGGDNVSDIENGVVTFTTAMAETKEKYSGATLAVLRSKKDDSGTAVFDEETDIQISSVGSNALSNFTITASTGPLTAYTNGITVSMDETKDNYIAKVFGRNPKQVGNMLSLYVEEVYPHFVREAVARGEMGTIESSLVFKNDDSYTDYTSDYQNSETPYVVSQVIGGQVYELFKFHTISDGDSSAEEIKISIANIDTVNYTFDVYVRKFNDTDATASTTALEKFSNVTLDETKSNFIGKIIGTENEEYPLKSMFIKVEMAESYPDNIVPAGFKGYEIKGNSSSAVGKSPDIYYKTTYLSGDSVFKTYLGISELGYTSLTQSNVTSRNSVKTIEKDLFKYHGASTEDKTTIKGFHLENTADSDYYVLGEKASLTAYTKANYDNITDKTQLKFTLVPYGGFDGFNKYANYSETYEEFDSETTNIAQFKSAIDILSNTEDVDINLLVTPGVNFYNNEEIVKYALDMAEDRADTLYIIDSPRITTSTAKGTPEEVINYLESTGIDSNYATTFWPWVQIEDAISGKYTYQSPTFLAVKAIALTDNVAAPWYAPAGFNRGLAGNSVKRADIKLKKTERDTLYGGRVNPIATIVQQGVVILGQKTMQIDQTALDRISVRRLLLQVRRLVAAASQTLLFEPNDQTLRDQFLSRVEPILLNIQNQRGLYSFKIIMDDTNNNNDTLDRSTLVGKIQLKPTKAMEFLDLTFQVLPQGANFEDF